MRFSHLWNHFLLRCSYFREHFTGVRSARRSEIYRRLHEAEPARIAGEKNLPARVGVFRGMAKTWPARKWTLAYFAKNYGNEPCNLLTDYGLADFAHRAEYRQSSLRKVAGEIRAGRKIYLRFSPLIEEKPELKAALDIRWLHSFRRWDSLSEAFHLFIGSKGTYTRLHAEMEISVFMQLQGRKRWRLFPPGDYAKLYPCFMGRTHFVTEFDAWRSSAQFPRVAGAEMTEVILEPGDVLYVPPFWWHYAENLDDGIGVAYRCNSPSLALRSSPFLTMMRLLAHNPSALYTLYHALFTRRNPLFESKR